MIAVVDSPRRALPTEPPSFEENTPAVTLGTSDNISTYAGVRSYTVTRIGDGNASEMLLNSSAHMQVSGGFYLYGHQ